MDTLAKMSQNIFPYCFVSDHSKHLIFIILLAFCSGGLTRPLRMQFLFYVHPILLCEIKLFQKKSSFIQGIKHGVQYTNLQSETIQITLFRKCML